jgi:hypothetical protein
VGLWPEEGQIQIIHTINPQFYLIKRGKLVGSNGELMEMEFIAEQSEYWWTVNCWINGGERRIFIWIENGGRSVGDWLVGNKRKDMGREKT